MILTVTLNAAVDVTYRVKRLSNGEPVRVGEVLARAGGKGLNVASVLSLLGADVVATGLVGGARGRIIRRLLADDGISDARAEIEAESRQTVTIVGEDGSLASYDEPGPKVSSTEWQEFRRRFIHLLDGCEQVVLAGSLPSSVPENAYGDLGFLAGERGVPVLLDAEGRWLYAGLAAGPATVKVNRGELAECAGHSLERCSEVLEAARAVLQASRARTVIATISHAGSILITGDGALWARPPEQRGNPVGAGDAFTAAWVAAADRPLTDRLRYATAVSAASVRRATAGSVDLLDIEEIAPLVEVGAA